jgi:hypothetical protein
MSSRFTSAMCKELMGIRSGEAVSQTDSIAGIAAFNGIQPQSFGSAQREGLKDKKPQKFPSRLLANLAR